MTIENQNTGSEYGIEKRVPGKQGWVPIITPGMGFETYEEAYQIGLAMKKELKKPASFRIVVYDYNGSKRKNIRVLTTITLLEPWIEKAMNEMIDIAPTGEDENDSIASD